MAAFTDLPADQKAVLQLVLRQGRTYEEIAGLLKISPQAVRERALTALDAIGPAEADGVSATEQDDAGDYLLGQQGASARASTRALLETSAPVRGWARGVSAELRAAGIAAEDSLPEIPADEAEIDEAFGALDARRTARVEQQRSSRLGGALLLVALAIVITGVVLYAAGAFKGKDKNDDSASSAAVSTATTSTTSTTSTTGAGTGATVQAAVALKPPSGAPNPKALGAANVLSQDGKQLIAIVAQGLPASNHYVMWLRNGSKVERLGFFKPQATTGTSKGKLVGQVVAPADIAGYDEMLISHESASTPTAPTTVELSGALKLTTG